MACLSVAMATAARPSALWQPAQVREPPHVAVVFVVSVAARLRPSEWQYMLVHVPLRFAAVVWLGRYAGYAKLAALEYVGVLAPLFGAAVKLRMRARLLALV